MGMRRIKSWSRLTDRGSYDYSAVPDDDLLAMQPIARHETAIFLYDTRASFLMAQDYTGLYRINLELSRRGLKPPQEGKA
jgi:hypothetical protein